jgi:cysteine desulfurase/selenocysteine lyase
MTAVETSRWREEFPSAARAVHMNHAGLAPISRRVAAAIHRFAEEALANEVGTSARWEARAEEVRALFARWIGAQPSEAAFVRNTSGGLSLVAAGLDWKPGDNVVAVADDYPSNIYPWWGLRRFGVETRLVARPHLRFGVDEVRGFADQRTRLVAVSAVDWQSGFRVDLASLGTFCRERGILFCVDGIQAVGALAVDVEAAGIDCMAVGGHKWLLAPEGCGGLFVSRRVVERIRPVLLGWKSVVDRGGDLPYHFDLRPGAERFEEGTLPHLGIHALGAALELLHEVGRGRVERAILQVNDALAEGLLREGATILSPWQPAERSGILTFRLGDAAVLIERLARDGVRAKLRLGGVRLSPHFYNDLDDVGRVLEVARAYRGSL